MNVLKEGIIYKICEKLYKYKLFYKCLSKIDFNLL